MAVRHIFLWRVAEGHRQQEILDILNTLPARVPGIEFWQAGTHQGDPGDNGAPWDGALITDFASWDGLETYSTDPYHLEVVEKLLPRFAERAVVDYEIGG
ncbi:Dabb family protein [Amycolatopsis sp. NPDC059090]|uniref:Dabb family protein n=1 Tax=unclassified Amycolatopsis TaxID=2618356 RepID=UPI00366E8EFC